MIHQGGVKGAPLVAFVAARATIEAGFATSGMFAYASDTGEFGHYVGPSGTWCWHPGAVEAFQVALCTVDSPTYTTLADFINSSQSVGKIGGGAITDNGDGTVAVALGTGMIRSTDSDVGALCFFDWPASASLALTNNSLNYVLVQYNAGSPQVAATDDFATIDFNTEFVIGYLYRRATDIDILLAGNLLPNHQVESCLRLFHRGVERMTGASIGEKATRYLTSTAGILYLGECKISTPAKDTQVDEIEGYWYLLNGTWTIITGETQIDNIQYNDVSTPGAEVLADLTANRYGVHWVYLCLEGDINVLYGQGDYTLAQADLAQPPASIPDYLSTYAILAAKVIIQKSAAAFISIESAHVTLFVPASVTVHADLSTLQGGQAAEYYHLESAEHAELHAWLDDVILGASGEITTPGAVTLDDGVGDSPPAKFVGGSNDDTAEIYLDDDPDTGESDLNIKLCDAAGESKLQVTDSGDNVKAAVDSDGNTEIEGDLTLDRDGQTDNLTRIENIKGAVADNAQAIAQVKIHNYDGSEYEAARIESYNEDGGGEGDLRLYTKDGALAEQLHIHQTGIVDFNTQSRARATQTTLAQVIVTGVVTLVNWETETYDAQDEFDSTTNERFTPTKAGYYAVTASIQIKFSGSSIRWGKMWLYKNGAAYSLLDADYGESAGSLPPTNAVHMAACDHIYLDGVTDYIDIRVWHNLPGANGTIEEAYVAIHKLS